jgi:hypothetical protein
MARDFQLEAQLQHDFQTEEISLRNGLEIGDTRISLSLTTRELVEASVFSREGKQLYQVLVNLVFREVGRRPASGTLAAELLLDTEAVQTNYVQRGLARQRIAVVETDGEALAVEFELEDDERQAIADGKGRPKLIPRTTTITDEETRLS